MESTELTQVARQRADVRIDAALVDIRQALTDIAKRHRIPDGVQGHTPEDLLGRISQVPSMSRELRLALGQALARQEIELMTRAPVAETPPAVTQPPPQKPRELKNPGRIPGPPAGLDVDDLKGISPQVARALKAAGLKTVGDVVAVPDDHLVKIGGIGERSLAQIREALAAAAVEG